MKGYEFAQGDSLKERLKSTGDSLFVRAVGRSTKPAWGNRLVKDFYDLDYDMTSSLAKITEKFTRKEPGRVVRANLGLSKGMLTSKETIDSQCESISKRKESPTKLLSP
jgi:hypothetical protein